MKTNKGRTQSPDPVRTKPPLAALSGPFLGLIYIIVFPFYCLLLLASLCLYQVVRKIAGLVQRVVNATAHA